MTEQRQLVKHTPGPWHLDEYEGIQRVCGKSSIGCSFVIAELYGPANSDLTGERKGNEYLIAAAPDLLVALTDLLNAEYNDTVNPEVIANAVRAIGKANGRSV
jgi:hypothetical protein